MKLEFTAITSRGKVRSENQDTIFLPSGWLNEDTFEAHIPTDSERKLLFAVFDGMGGELCGKEASILAAQTLSAQPLDTAFETLCFAMNDAICRYMKENDVKAMGTTAAMVRIYNEKVEYCNLGDSRIYLIDGLSMYRLSKDHTVTVFGDRKALTQHLGISPKEILIEPHTGTVPIKSGSNFLLCSDGLTDLLAESEIGKTIITNPNKEAAHCLVDEALKRGGKDNISVILIHIQ